MIVAVLLLLAISAEGAYEGDFCIKDGVEGVCKGIRDCPAALEDIKNRKQPQNCGFGGLDPIVCCVSSPSAPTATTRQPALTTTKRPLTSSTTEYIPPPEEYIDVGDKVADDQCEPIPLSLTSKRNGQKAWDKCLEYQERLVFPCGKSQALSGGFSRTNRCHHNADELIIGGKAAALNEFPHMALLGYGDEPNIQWLCGGSLISEKFILTAGHCIASRDGGDVTYVQVGTLRRSSMLPKNRFKVKSIIKHPQYTSPHKYHDIALLELETPVPLDEYIVPACVHTGSPVNDSRASVTGWGLTTYNGKTADDLQKVILTKFDALECALTYKPNRLMKNGLDDRSQICFGDRTMSKDTCQGDSGGPLQIKSKQIGCMYIIVGVTSFGAACGFVGVPGIYTRVSNYVDFIVSHVWP